jgi:predicted Zn-dependent protease
MNKRLEILSQLVESGQADSFARYALALEYKKAGRNDEALAAFEALRAADPDYLAMYYMAGQLLLDMDREAQARDWLEAGVEIARRKGESKTLGELEATLAEI